MSETISRRKFTQAGLSTLITASLLQTLLEHDAFADKVKPITEKWLKDLVALCGDLKKVDAATAKISQLQWQTKVESLFSKVELGEMLNLIDFDKLAASAPLKDQGESSSPVVFPAIEGLTNNLGFGRQLFAVKKGRSIAPHGHNNMATAFFILKGQFQGRHFDRVEDQPGYMIVKPTIDRAFGVGESSTISDFKDNVHWFQGVSDTAFIFNIHVDNVNPGSGKETGRVYIDPAGEKLSGGLIKARIINGGEAYKLYG
jgi:hypothetical protein